MLGGHRTPRFGFRTDLHRPDDGENADRVGYMELFFDLVFVYAITALTQLLVHEQTWHRLLATVLLGTAIWWTWISTGWVTNWLDPNRGPVRGLLISLMAASLVLSGTIGDVLHGGGAAFAITLVVMNLGRPLFALLALWQNRRDDAANFVNLTLWVVASAPLWVIGAFTAEPLLWWTLAVVVDLLGPAMLYAVPGLGHTQYHAWKIRGAHLAERVSLFVLIALGESIALIGEHIAEALPDPLALVSLTAAFAHTVLLWFLYFDRSESLGSRRIRGADQTGAIARNTYSYTAALLVFGIVLSAGATDIAFEQAGETSTPLWTAGLLIGANVVCLSANLLFRLSLSNAPFRSHVPAVLVSLALIPLHGVVSPLAMEWALVLVLGVVVLTDAVSARRRDTDEGNSGRPVGL
jgi:low temperature requirement protein LtrA